jgi:hypothetical protein
MNKYLEDRQVSSFIYTPGGPPGIDYIRHSTFDINDGRQSFAIQNTFSFIMEGMNGTDAFIDRMQRRAECQMTGMRGLLEYAYQNKKEIKKTVAKERKRIIHSRPGEHISIQLEHARNGEKLSLPLFSYYSNTDTTVTVLDYRPVVRSLYDVEKPSGYLIPRQLEDVTDWVKKQGLSTESFTGTKNDKIEQYEILSIDSIDFEGEIIVNPAVTLHELNPKIAIEDYIYVPTSHLKGNIMVIALEPKSMLGLVTYKNFAHLLKAGEKYPVLRVIKK